MLQKRDIFITVPFFSISCCFVFVCLLGHPSHRDGVCVPSFTMQKYNHFFRKNPFPSPIFPRFLHTTVSQHINPFARPCIPPPSCAGQPSAPGASRHRTPMPPLLQTPHRPTATAPKPPRHRSKQPPPPPSTCPPHPVPHPGRPYATTRRRRQHLHHAPPSPLSSTDIEPLLAQCRIDTYFVLSFYFIYCLFIVCFCWRNKI